MQTPNPRDTILAEYDRSAPLYNALALAAKDLLEKVLPINLAKREPIACRVKDRSSFSGKLDRPGKNYKTFAEITDVVGLRVVTYFIEDIDKVAAIVESTFSVDQVNSVDKRGYSDADRFGYQSMQFVVSFTDARCDLPENRAYRGLKFEIQVRSILQHSWAEIQHSLGAYKAPRSVPRHVRRKFARIAGLLGKV